MTTPQSVDDTRRSLLESLEASLRDISHDDKPLEIIRNFAKGLGKTKHRQRLFNSPGALVRSPIQYQEMLTLNIIDADEDTFTLLQGDVVSTDAAYFLGQRIEGAKFAIASSTCDLIAGRRKYSALLLIHPIHQNDKNARNLLGEMLAFKTTTRMYLPPLPNDPPDVIANAVLFDGVYQIRLEDLLLATRHCSLSLSGWRIFGSLIRGIMVRAGASEVKMRTAIWVNATQ